MANELRIYQNFAGGRIDNNPLASGGTSLSSPDLASLIAVASTEHLMIVLDPDALAGAPEAVKVTAHTASATTATITRAQNGTSARQHAAGTDWVHAAVDDDYKWIQFGTGAPESVVTAPVGSLWIRTDGGTSTTLYVKESGTGNTGWVAK